MVPEGSQSCAGLTYRPCPPSASCATWGQECVSASVSFPAPGLAEGKATRSYFWALWGLLGELTAAGLFKENCALSINSRLTRSELLTLWG